MGIDPGTIRMGVGILDGNRAQCQVVAFESIGVRALLPLPERLKEFHASIQDFIDRFQPEVMALENVFFGKDVRALVKMGEARGSVMLAAASRGIPVVEYPPARIKEAVSGNGRASKIQIQQMMKHLLRLQAVPPVDAADALAVALCHLHSVAHHVRIPVGPSGS